MLKIIQCNLHASIHHLSANDACKQARLVNKLCFSTKSLQFPSFFNRKKLPSDHQQTWDWRKWDMWPSLNSQHPKLGISYNEPSHWLMPVFWCCQGNQQRLLEGLRQTNQPFQEDTMIDERVTKNELMFVHYQCPKSSFTHTMNLLK